MKNYLSLILALLFIVACQNSSTEENEIGSIDSNNLSEITDTLINEKKSLDLTGLSDTSLARVYLDSAVILTELGDFNKALFFSNKAIANFNISNSKADTTLVKIYLQQGEIFSKFSAIDSMIIKAKKAAKLSIPLLGENNIFIARSEKILGTAEVWLGNYDAAIEHYEYGLRIYKEKEISLNEEVGNIHNNIGLVYDWQSKVELSRKHHQKSLKILKTINEYHPRITNSYLNLGSLEQRNGRFHLALDYFKKGLEFAKKVYGKKHLETANFYGSLGATYNSMGNFHKALIYNRKCLDLFLAQNNPDSYNLAVVYSNLGETMGYIDKYKQEGLAHKIQALKIYIKLFGENNSTTASGYANLATYHTDLNNYQEAISNFEKAIAIFKKVNQDRSLEMLSTLNNLGIVYSNMKDYDKSLEVDLQNLQLKKEILGPTHPNLVNSLVNISLDWLNKKEFDKAKAILLEALLLLNYNKNSLADERYAAIEDIKACRATLYSLKDYYFLRLKESSKDKPIYLDSLHNHLLELLAFENYLQRKNYTLEMRKMYLSETKEVYEGLIQTCIWRNRQDEFPNAFEISEKTKARLLTEEVKSEYNVYFSNLPDSLKEKEQNLKADLASYEKKKYQAKYESNPPNDSLISEYQNKIFDLKREQDELMEVFKTEYPDYWNLKYNFDVASVQDVQNKLQKDQVLVEYFTGDSSIFIFVLTNDTLDIKEVKNDFPLTDWVKDMRDGMLAHYDPQTILSNSALDSLDQLYKRSAFQLYDKLLAPIEAYIPEETKLIIVPDGVLGYLPFDALLTSPANDPNAIRTADYLIKKHQISYAYSATLWLEMINKKVSPTKGLLAVAPTFPKSPQAIAMQHYTKSGVRDSLYFLENSLSEIEAINDIWGADMLKDQNANLSNFLTQAGDFRILHLSTHGKADDRVGDYCFLAFTKVADTLENLLYVRDLYNIELNADMIVLSACETGLGELQKGEGILSLARGFVYAGAKSIISTLWKVEEHSTQEIMESFYTNLSIGMTKDKALRQAKLHFINNSTEPYPYHWAAFTAVGDMSALDTNQSVVKYVLIGFLLLLFSLFIFAKFIQNK